MSEYLNRHKILAKSYYEATHIKGSIQAQMLFTSYLHIILNFNEKLVKLIKFQIHPLLPMKTYITKL